MDWIIQLGGIAENAGAAGAVIVLLMAIGVHLKRSSQLDKTTYDRIIAERDHAYQQRDEAIQKFAEADAERDQLRLQAAEFSHKLQKAEENEQRLTALEAQVRKLSEELRKATDLISNQNAVIQHMEKMLQGKGATCQP